MKEPNRIDENKPDNDIPTFLELYENDDLPIKPLMEDIITV
jgi:hypothetical protein